MPQVIDQLLIGCADLGHSRAFFTELFGLAVQPLRSTPPPLPGSSHALRAECALTGMAETGDTLLHLVSFERPGAAVRDGAGRHDACPKTINFLCRNLPDRYRELQAAGVHFASDWVEYEKHGVHYRDVHLTGPDHQNIGLLELVGETYPVNDRGIGTIAAVCFTQSAIAEADALAHALDLTLAFDETLSGEAMETLVGLPHGAALIMHLYGDESPRGRLEFVEYRGAGGSNRYSTARPPASGLLHARIHVEDFDPTESAAEATPTLKLGPLHEGILLGQPVRSRFLETDSGMRVELIEHR